MYENIFSSFNLTFSQLQRELAGVRSEMKDYQTRMEELRRLNEQQRDQFRNTLSEVKSQLQDAVIAKEAALQLR